MASFPLLLVRAYKHHVAWSGHDDAGRAEAAARGYAEGFRTLREARWPALADAVEPPLREWLCVERFDDLYMVDRWEAHRPFAGVVGGVQVVGVTARLTSRSVSTRRNEITGERAVRRAEQFAGLVLRAETARPVEAPVTLFTLGRGWLSGRFDRWVHAEPSRHGRRILSGDEGFEARFALHGEERSPVMSARARALAERIAVRHGAVRVAWRGNELLTRIACGRAWDEGPRGVEVLQDALDLVVELASVRA